MPSERIPTKALLAVRLSSVVGVDEGRLECADDGDEDAEGDDDAELLGEAAMAAGPRGGQQPARRLAHLSEAFAGTDPVSVLVEQQLVVPRHPPFLSRHRCPGGPRDSDVASWSNDHDQSQSIPAWIVAPDQQACQPTTPALP